MASLAGSSAESLLGASFNSSLCQLVLPRLHIVLPHVCASAYKHMEIEYYEYCRGNLSTYGNVSYDYKTMQKLRKWHNHTLRLKAVQLLWGVVYETCINLKAISPL